MLNEEIEETGKTRNIKRIERDLGADLLKVLHDPRTVEIMLNADGKLWQERLGESMQEIGRMDANKATSIINSIASYHRKVVSASSPLLEAELPIDGSRFAGQIPPVVSSPTFAIRKKASQVFSLENYVVNGIITELQKAAIIDSVKSHDNIFIVGSTGSGKTTLANAIILEMTRLYPNERVFIIEDTGEIQCSAENYVQYHTDLNVTMTQLLRTTLRMRPDRIIVGEVRGAEALDLLDAWNTGHAGGVATIHANSSSAGLTRLKSLVTRNQSAPKEIEPLIGEAVQLVIFITRTQTGRKVTELLKVTGYTSGQYSTTKL